MNDRDQRFAEGNETETPQEVSVPPAPSEHFFTKVHNRLDRLHLLTAFCENPTNVSFQTQEPDERVLVFLRKSMWVNFPWIFATGVFLVVPFFVFLLRSSIAQFIPPFPILLITVSFYYLLVALYAFVNFITWYYNTALITNKRVVDVDFHQIVFKDVAETKLALIQDVSYNQTGVLPNILGFGYVLIQTAGTLDNFEFYNLPHPDRVEEIVEDLIGGRRMYEP